LPKSITFGTGFPSTSATRMIQLAIGKLVDRWHHEHIRRHDAASDW